MNLFQRQRAVVCVLAVIHGSWGFVRETPPGETVCGVGDEFISIAGSTTVQKLSLAWSKAYLERCNVTVDVEGGGSRDGAARLCAVPSQSTPVDIGDMSRNWSVPEEALVDQSGWKFQCVIGDDSRTVLQMEVAIDAVSIVMQKDGSGAKCVEAMGGLTTDQLRWIYSSYTEGELTDDGWDASVALPGNDNDPGTHHWSELSTNPACEAIEIDIAGPDSGSGTFDFFREVILTDHDRGSEDFPKTRSYYNESGVGAIDRVANFTASKPYAIAYFGYSYYFGKSESLYLAKIQNKFSPDYVEPNENTIPDGTYAPLSRKVFMNLYNDAKSLENTVPFIRYALTAVGTNVLLGVGGYIALPEDRRTLMLDRIGGDGIPKNSTPTADPTATSSSMRAGVSFFAFGWTTMIAFMLAYS